LGLWVKANILEYSIQPVNTNIEELAKDILVAHEEEGHGELEE
jgi:hypothetical protein